MTLDQALIFSLIILLLFFFVWGRYRYDIVALSALVLAVLIGVVDSGEAFSGFGHPAVITVAMVLIVSKGLMNSGIVDWIARFMQRFSQQAHIQIMLLVCAVTFASAFMNNVGALALFMPVALRMARKSGHSPSLYLMPLAFGSLLGGLMTVIGTPPNIIISTFRTSTDAGTPFKMFDFFPVGIIITVFGLAFILLFSKRLIPVRIKSGTRDDLFDIENYVTEISVPSHSKLVGARLSELSRLTDEDFLVLAHIRDGERFDNPSMARKVGENDRLIIKTNTDALQTLIDVSGFILADQHKLVEDDLTSGDIMLAEVIVPYNSEIIDRNARNFNLRKRYSVNLLGVARQGGRIRGELKNIRFKNGDVLLLQGSKEHLSTAIQTLHLYPLQERELRLGRLSRVFLALGIFFVSIIITALGILPVQIAFTLAALAMIIGKFVPLRHLYESIDWPIIILLGALIPVSTALETTGGALLIATQLASIAHVMPLWVTLALVMVLTMSLSNIINNAAAALIMAPIAIGIALSLGVSTDPFLMGTAIGASSAFLTPIGHQSNTLVMGPGGYRFGDYWRLGLPLSILIILVSLPAILMIWPL